jgi:hypothetical protein
MDDGTAWVINMSIIVGGVLLYPVARGIGAYLTSLADRGRKVAPTEPAPALQTTLDRTRDELERTRAELDALSERHEFLEALVTGHQIPAVAARSGARDGSS